MSELFYFRNGGRGTRPRGSGNEGVKAELVFLTAGFLQKTL